MALALLLSSRVNHTPTALPWPDRVLMTTDSSEGMWAYTLELSRTLSSFGVQVTLAALGEPRSARQRRESERITGLEVHDQPSRLAWTPDNPWSNVAATAGWLRTLDARVAPNLVHMNHLCHAGIGWSAPTLIVAIPGTGVVGCGERRARPRDLDQLSLRDRGRPAQREPGRHTNRGGAAGAGAVLRAGPRRARDSSGRDSRWFAPAEKEPLIVATGRLDDEAANLEVLADVAGMLPWPIEVIEEGDGDRVREALGRASIFAMPTSYAPFAMPALDAALSGCASCSAMWRACARRGRMRRCSCRPAIEWRSPARSPT